MSIFESPDTLKLIQNLFIPSKDESSDSENEGNRAVGFHKLGPGNIAQPVKDKKKVIEGVNKPIETEKTTQSIEEWQEMQEKEDAETLETRKRPDYNISYKQNVTTEDVFLQMGNKSPATASCEEIIIEIKMPDESCGNKKMELNVSDREIDLKTPKYRLKLPLIHSVNPDKGKATWNKDMRIFMVRLVLAREFDFVNF